MRLDLGWRFSGSAPIETLLNESPKKDIEEHRIWFVLASGVHLQVTLAIERETLNPKEAPSQE